MKKLLILALFGAGAAVVAQSNAPTNTTTFTTTFLTAGPPTLECMPSIQDLEDAKKAYDDASVGLKEYAALKVAREKAMSECHLGGDNALTNKPASPECLSSIKDLGAANRAYDDASVCLIPKEYDALKAAREKAISECNLGGDLSGIDSISISDFIGITPDADDINKMKSLKEDQSLVTNQ